jgi:ABC-type sugar transport system ATPase subunit
LTPVLVLDEPTAALTDSEAERLSNPPGLKKEGVGIVYLSHNLEEVNASAIAPLSCGTAHRSNRRPAPDIDRRPPRLMVGTDVKEPFPKLRSRRGSPPVQNCTDLTGALPT